MRLTSLVLPVLLVFSLCVQAQASIVVGGISFADDAFADVLVAEAPVGISLTNAADTATAVLGPTLASPGDGLGTQNFATLAGTAGGGGAPSAWIEVRFDNAIMVSGAGTNDLAFFEMGSFAESFVVTIGATSMVVDTVYTGFDDPILASTDEQINVGFVDLTDFGFLESVVAAGLVVKIAATDGPPVTAGENTPDIAAVGALPVPEPGTMAVWSLLSMCMGVCVWRKRR